MRAGALRESWQVGSLALRGTPFDLDRYDCLVVEGFFAGGVFGNRLEQGSYNAFGRLVGTGLDDAFHTCASEHFPGTVASVKDTVAEEDEHIAWLGFERELFILGIVKQARRKSCRLDDFHVPVVHVEGAWQAGV